MCSSVSCSRNTSPASQASCHGFKSHRPLQIELARIDLSSDSFDTSLARPRVSLSQFRNCGERMVPFSESRSLPACQPGVSFIVLGGWINAFGSFFLLPRAYSRTFRRSLFPLSLSDKHLQWSLIPSLDRPGASLIASRDRMRPFQEAVFLNRTAPPN